MKDCLAETARNVFFPSFSCRLPCAAIRPAEISPETVREVVSGMPMSITPPILFEDRSVVLENVIPE